jgi:hypothetical protein
MKNMVLGLCALVFVRGSILSDEIQAERDIKDPGSKAQDRLS